MAENRRQRLSGCRIAIAAALYLDDCLIVQGVSATENYVRGIVAAKELSRLGRHRTFCRPPRIGFEVFAQTHSL
jgi:hypothetical protein